MMRTDENWKLVIGAILVQRGAGAIVPQLLRRWPRPELLCRADTLEVARLCGMQHKRARQLIRFSSKWLGTWSDLSELVPKAIAEKFGHPDYHSAFIRDASEEA